MFLLNKILTVIAMIFAPTNARFQYNRYGLWERPWRYIIPNAAFLALWACLLAVLAPAWPFSLALQAFLFLNAAFVVAGGATCILPRFGIGPDTFNDRAR